MNFLSRRLGLIAACGLLFASGAVGVACSSNPADDSSGGDSAVDSTVDGVSPTEGGKDGGGMDAAPIQQCDASVGGMCNIVAQDCPSGKECAAVKQADGGFLLQCQNTANGNQPEGHSCNPGTNNPCLTGLECIEHRCARHCCLGDDQACGPSNPEGFLGKCDLNVTLDGTSTAYSVCSYNKPCEPFQIEACGPGLTCLVQDMNGTATCSAYSNGGDAGLAEKAKCSFGNDCSDGMGCYGAPDGGGFTCQWNCYIPPGPFDAGIKEGGAGKGGCPGSEKCGGAVTGLPTWFGLCQ
jgi:hypothetical protein